MAGVTIGKLQHDLVRRRPWQLFGFGCLYAWLLSVVVFGTFFAPDAPAPWRAFVRLAMLAGMLAGYLACYLARDTPPMASFSRPKVLAFSLAMALGTLCVAFPIEGPAACVVVPIAAAAAGAGMAYHMNAGGVLWSAGPGELSLVQLTASVAAAFGASMLLALAPHVVAVAVTCVLPVVGAVILTNTREEGRPARIEREQELTQGSAERRLVAAVCGVSAAFGCAFVMLGGAGGLGAWGLVPLACAVGAFACGLRVTLERFLDGAFRTCSWLLGAGFLLAALGGAASVRAGSACAVLLAGYVLFDEYLWLVHTGLVHKGGLSVAYVVSRYEALQWAGLTLGCLAGFALTQAGLGEEATRLAAVACGTCALFLLAVVFSPAEARKVVERRERMGFGPTLEERCLELAVGGGLSPRELEVLRLLARGRSAAHIQGELGIAEGTVKVHARNIYRKLGVESKQGLIDLVDATGGEPGAG